MGLIKKELHERGVEKEFINRFTETLKDKEPKRAKLQLKKKFGEMKPTNLDVLEGETLDDMHKLGKALMQWKLDEWNTQLRKETCSACGSNLENRFRFTHKQVCENILNFLA